MAKEETNEVAVTMTKEQRDEYVAYQASKKKAAEPKAPEDMMDIDLAFQHTRTNVTHGTKSYGPGLVKNVPESIAWSLYSADQKAVQSQLKQMTDNGNMVEIIARGVVRPVKSAPRTV